MSHIKSSSLKETLVRENRRSKKAPIWVFAKTNRKVRDSPKSRRHWRRNNIF
ncbi:MAG: hypothetical protein KAU03_05040 [Candidatus Altiarchaeales archaeon]|nr:hypothetical protein [Candidatus Altiarchaeales archaeon]